MRAEVTAVNALCLGTGRTCILADSVHGILEQEPDNLLKFYFLQTVLLLLAVVSWIHLLLDQKSWLYAATVNWQFEISQSGSIYTM
jgi:hypothetical protein